MKTFLKQLSTHKNIGALILFFSVLSLIGALIIEYTFDLAPCEMCLEQRYAHLGAAIFAFLSLQILPMRKYFLIFAMISLFIGGVIALDQYGLEMRWWSQEVSCIATPSLESQDTFRDQLFSNVEKPCDVKGYSLFGLTLSGLNAVASFSIVLLTLATLFIKRRKS